MRSGVIPVRGQSLVPTEDWTSHTLRRKGVSAESPLGFGAAQEAAELPGPDHTRLQDPRVTQRLPDPRDCQTPAPSRDCTNAGRKAADTGRGLGLTLRNLMSVFTRSFIKQAGGLGITATQNI